MSDRSDVKIHDFLIEYGWSEPKWRFEVRKGRGVLDEEIRTSRPCRVFALLPDALTGRPDARVWGRTLWGTRFPGHLLLMNGGGATVYSTVFDASVWKLWNRSWYLEVPPGHTWEMATQERMNQWALEAELSGESFDPGPPKGWLTIDSLSAVLNADGQVERVEGEGEVVV